MDRLPRILLLFLGIGLLLAALACGSSNVERPKGTPGPGPSWGPQEAIEQIDELPRSFDKDAAWNASFDPYQGRWRVELIYQVRMLYPPRDDRREVAWYVYEETGEVVGPLD